MRCSLSADMSFGRATQIDHAGIVDSSAVTRPQDRPDSFDRRNDVVFAARTSEKRGDAANFSLAELLRRRIARLLIR